MSDSYLLEDGPEDVNDYPLSTRFKARRAILNTITQAKIIDGTYNPEPFKCTRPNSGWLANWFSKEAD